MSTAAPESKKRFRCLVIQMARLGDTLQTLMALRAAKQLYPNLEIHLIARERFAAAARRVPWLDGVTVFPTEQILTPVLTGAGGEQESIANAARWLRPLVSEPWDLVLNWTYSEASSYLASLIPAKVRLGYTRRNDMTHSSPDGWSQYIQAILQGGIGQNIHLTDILTTQLLTALQIHVGEPSDSGDAAVTSKGFFRLELTAKDLGIGWHDSSKKWLAFQLGASQSAKTWDPSNWSKFANFVLERHPDCNIVILGGAEDEERLAQFYSGIDSRYAESRRIMSMVGQTSFDLWASVVGRCQWLFAGDTAAIHLASVLGTRVMNISVGPVRWAETGPYGNGHYIISGSQPCARCEGEIGQAQSGSEEHTCRTSVTPESVYASWSYAMNEWAHRRQSSIETHLAQIGMKDALRSVRVHRSRIRGTSEGGGVVYENVSQTPLRMSDWLAMVMGHVARGWYCGWVPPLGQELTRESINPSIIQSMRQLEEAIEVLSKVCTEAHLTATQLTSRSSGLKSDRVMSLQDRDQLRDIAKKLFDLEKLVERVAEAQVPLRVFSQMLKVMMHNLRGNQLSELGLESVISYAQLNEGIAAMREWIKFTLALAKPVEVKGATVISLAKPASSTSKDISP